MFCPQCGTKVADGARFCPSCGHALDRGEKGEAAPSGVAASPEAVAPTGVAATPEAPAPAAPVPAAPAPDPAPKRRRGRLVAALVAAVVLVAAVGAGVWFGLLASGSGGGQAGGSSVERVSYPIDEQNFSDPVLRAVVSDTYDTNHDGQLSPDEGDAVTDLTLSGATSLTGLGRCFPNLSSITATGGTLAQLDVSDAGALTSIDAADEPLATLDVSHNPELSSLSVPQTTQVTGVEGTRLHECWVVSGVTEDYGNGYATTYTAERDAAGRVTARQTKSDESLARWEYAYDDKGRVVSEHERLVSYGDTLSDTQTTYAYDEAGRLVSEATDGGSIAYAYTYDDAGRLATRGMGGDGEGPVRGTTYAYDDAGRLASETYRNQSDQGTVTSYTYDDQGNLTQIQSYDETLGEVSETITYQRDANGNLTSVSGAYFYDTYTAPVSYSYDDAGRLTSATAELEGTTYTAEVTYDDNGNVAAIVERAGTFTTTYTPSYVRCFVAEGAAEPPEGIRVGVEEVPLVGAQRTSLVNVWAVPPITPTPRLYAQPGDSMIILF